MDALTSESPRLAGRRDWLAVGVWVVLTAAAIIYLGYHLWIARSRHDTNHLETPLALSLARQGIEGLGVLYGPFTADRPLVLIHAPLYYRVAGLLAWPATRLLGVDPVWAALVAGRVISLVAFAVCLWVTALLARLDGAPAQAGWWALLLLATSAVFGSTPVTVRPDTLGIALQSAGLLLVLSWLMRDARRIWPLGMAYVLFALGFGTKQHDVVVGAVCSALLFASGARGVARWRAILVAHAVGIAVVAGYLGFEYVVTGGRVIAAVFRLPAQLRQVAPADWGHVALVVFEVAKRSLGLGLLALVVLAGRPWRTRLAGLDRLLLLVLGAEVVATLILCRGSEGAWVNYAMQPVLLGCVFVGRGMSACVERLSGRIGWRGGAILVGALVLLAADARLVWISARARQRDLAAVEALLDLPMVRFHAPEGLYFAGAADHNRLFGRGDLAHDEWLYAAFERLGAAAPRGDWLQSALVEGPVCVVATPTLVGYEAGRIPGLTASLPELGYRQVARLDRYHVWCRETPAGRPAARPNP